MEHPLAQSASVLGGNIIYPFRKGRLDSQTLGSQSIGDDEIRKNGFNFLMIRPHRFENNFAALFDDINHVGERSVRNVHRAIEIVYQHLCLDSVLVSALLRIVEFLFPSLMGSVTLPWMRLAHVDGQKLEARVAIIPVEIVEGRDLAHERRSSDTAKFQQYMFLVAEVGKPHSLSLETQQLEV